MNSMSRDQAVGFLTALVLLAATMAFNHGWIGKADLDAVLLFLGAGHLGYHVNNTAANVALNPEPPTAVYDDAAPEQLTP
jgi:hypothetical protein